ncbi:hypothetical protein [Methylobacterium brachythecii]|nr:hypothetical protein [Methylobacterium brachythecii]MBB3902818.1 hypothetical protein [Methylobacterium brachythecii]
MARCAAIRSIAPAVSAALASGTRDLVGALVDDAGKSFDLTADFDAMADFEKTGLTGRLGGGFTDLCMAKLGYAWMDLASNLLPGHSGRLGDFIYDGPATGGHGVVLVEAKATCASSVTATDVKGTAERGYRNQVDPYVGSTSIPGVGTIFQGYAVCLGAAPGVAGGFGHVVETAVATVPGGSGGGGGSSAAATLVGGRLAISNYRAVSNLINAPVLFAHLEQLLGRSASIAGHEQQRFLRLKVGDQWFLTGSAPSFDHWPSPGTVPPFMLDEAVAEPLLNQISLIVRQGRRPWDGLPTFLLPTTPESFGPDATGRFPFVRFPDGLAYVVGKIDAVSSRVWTPLEGLGPPVS